MDHDLMTGQWIGRVSGLNNGGIIIEADLIDDKINIDVYFYEDQPTLPSFFARFQTQATPIISEKIKIIPFDGFRGEIVTADFAERYPDVTFSPEIMLSLAFEKDTVHIRADYREGFTNGIASRRSKAQIADEANRRAEKVTWDQFKREISGLPLRANIFRGQSLPWPLMTSFHRTNRSLIFQYVQFDIRELSFAFATLKPQFMNLDDPKVFLSFLSFLQHHGFPTPFLDWSYSPYVAAYFGAISIASDSSVGESMRLFCFDWHGWEQEYPFFDKFALKGLHFSPVRAFPIENERALTQQSVVAMTNVSDIEDYLFSCERKVSRKYLRIFDISHSERDVILNDLELMGITAASLFPGPEGICRAERRLRFDSYK